MFKVRNMFGTFSPAQGTVDPDGRILIAADVPDGSNATQGSKADARATWYDSIASVVSLFKLFIAVQVDEGSHVVTFDTGGRPLTDTWTLFGVTRVKTFTYPNATTQTESAWVAS